MNALQILIQMAAEHRVGVGEVQSKCRRRNLVAARIAIAGRLRTERNLTIGQIAHLLNRASDTAYYYIMGDEKRERVKNRKRENVKRWRSARAA